MASTRELRRRIKSVKNTAQITKAMQMVAATKMRKAQLQAMAGRPYNFTLKDALSRLLTRTDVASHKLLQDNGGKSIGVVVFSTDKSLCGALNTNLFRAVQNFSKENSNLIFYTIGSKGRNFIVKTGKTLEADFENPEKVTFRQAVQLSRLILEQFNKGILKEVYLVYPDFVSALRQEPRIVKLLPIALEDLIKETLDSSLDNRQETKLKKQETNESEFLFEPDFASLLDFTLNHFLQVRVYQALLETKASEHSARMIAMQNATDNAKELVEDLQLTYNQTRQAAITTELLEITSASAAMQ